MKGIQSGSRLLHFQIADDRPGTLSGARPLHQLITKEHPALMMGEDLITPGPGILLLKHLSS